MASRTPQPWRWLAACMAVIALLYVGVAVGGSWTPKLGLDLEGGASAILHPEPTNHTKATAAQLNQSVNIIRDRVNSLGVAESEVSLAGGNIEVDVPGANEQQLQNVVGRTAQLRFRQVIDVQPVAPASATPSASATVTPSGSPAATTSAAPTGSAAPATTTPAAPTTTTKPPAVIKPSPTSNGRALSSALLAAGASSAPTTTAAPTPATTPAASGAPASGAPASAAPAATGSAAAASASAAAAAVPCQTINTTQPPSCLTPAVQKQIALLGDCSANKLSAVSDTQGIDLPNQPLAACDRNGGFIYVLAPAYMNGSSVKSASSQYDAQNGFSVQLNFTAKGTSQFAKLTEAVTSLPSPLNQVAIVLDGVVQSAPSINEAIPSGTAQITGGTASAFTQTDTEQLAQVLNYGSLPIALKLQTIELVSPTLGSDQLRGGLIAGAIGLGLVVIFSLLYYRGLGLVSVASLMVSAVVTFATVIVLGHAIGYRLSLAGIAGFIVAVGITADSFVVYFERLRDEVREGRTLRSGAERAWVRARRTIISADSVSLIAAVVLYKFSVGNVKGFAFTLGLSTVTDLFVVFFFTKPLISYLATTKLYGGGGKFSGLGRARVLGDAKLPIVSATPKEA